MTGGAEMPAGLSVVVPVYRGAEFLAELIERLGGLRAWLEHNGAPLRLVEVLFIDDDAIDRSAEVIERAARDRSWLRLIRLSRNYGQHAATIAGILHSSGDWVATMDEDLQHRPAHLLGMLRKAVDEQCDIVYAEPEGRMVHASWRDALSRAAKRVVGWLSRNPRVAHYNSYRLLRGGVARAAAAVAGPDTYLDVVLGWFSTRVALLAVPLRDIREQRAVPSGYRLSTLVRHARRLLMTSEIRFFSFATGLAAMALLLTAAAAVYIVVHKVWFPESIGLPGWASLILAQLLFGGLTVSLLVFVLEFLSVSLRHSQGKPVFFVVDRSHDRELLSWFAGKAEDEIPDN